jgi:3-methyladenine DNA glycosylase/8-oxoguanine DNA glycosylase
LTAKRINYAQELSEALSHLRRYEVLAPLLSHADQISLKPNPGSSPLYSLSETIIGQQLNGRAAKSIFERFAAMYGGVINADAILDTSEEAMRSAGLSKAKAIAIRDLAEKTKVNIVPSWQSLRRMDDETVIQRLTQVRGIGRWTAEMVLIFSLGRPDVWPVDDFAIRKAYGIFFGIEDPKPAEMRIRAEAWRPWRSVVARCLWMSLSKQT